MSDDFVKKPGQGGDVTKRRKRIMRTFKLNEISAVDTPAQEHATMSIMKRAEEPMEKVLLLTDLQDGHQHSVSIDMHALERGGGNTSYAGGDINAGERMSHTSEHSHDFIINPDGSITIAANQGHTHDVEISEFMGRLKLQAALSEVEVEVEIVQMRKSEDGKEFQASDFAMVPDATDPRTWEYRLVRKAGSNPDRRLVGNAVAALKRGRIAETEIPSFTRRVRSAWALSHSSSPRSDMPSVLKRVFS